MLKKVKSQGDYKNYFTSSRPEMLKFIPYNSRRILEVGCGEGNFGLSVKGKINCEYWGIEPFKDAAQTAKTKLDFVLNSNFDDAYDKLERNFFDCVVFNDVLEHFANPFDTLSKLFDIMPVGSSIIASIPNVRYAGNLYELLIKRDWEYKHEGGILDFTHLRFFTKKSTVRMFNQSGYEIIQIVGINPISIKKFLPINIITLGMFSDSRYLQFAVVAKKTIER